MGQLDGRVALVTGGGSGIGRAVVDRYVSEGCSVAVLELSAERAAQLRADHPDVLVQVGDATRYSDNRTAVRATEENFGRLDAFVANTGVWDFGLTAEQLPEDSDLDAAFEQVFAVNVKAYLVGAKAARQALVRSRGSVIMTVSNAGFHPGGGGPLYTAAKHAVVGLIRQLAYEFAPAVRVNGVAPGAMNTGLTGPRALGQHDFTISELPMESLISELSPLQFMPRAEDYTGWYTILASASDARTITGSVIECDGGERVRGQAASRYARERAGDRRSDTTS